MRTRLVSTPPISVYPTTPSTSTRPRRARGLARSTAADATPDHLRPEHAEHRQEEEPHRAVRDPDEHAGPDERAERELEDHGRREPGIDQPRPEVDARPRQRGDADDEVARRRRD